MIRHLDPDAGCPTADEANRALRAFARRTTWTPEALEELAQLRRIWADAVRREMVPAA
ncbi:hypothetical protein [Streptomyces sp. JJ36]|uniref:hypothetical protein n=1 Tax=Streptomyces sp. JJ36 TaxID=2736645 RepID=UPI001F3F208D|nr:hypothetical protein [Streptomyces sp. JJ36]MCF6525214.1 hypothetical protein [Streptomyces sp. JJ36]